MIPSFGRGGNNKQDVAKPTTSPEGASGGGRLGGLFSRRGNKAQEADTPKPATPPIPTPTPAQQPVASTATAQTESPPMRLGELLQDTGQSSASGGTNGGQQSTSAFSRPTSARVQARCRPQLLRMTTKMMKVSARHAHLKMYSLN